jgi:hypothetical protein
MESHGSKDGGSVDFWARVAAVRIRASRSRQQAQRLCEQTGPFAERLPEGPVPRQEPTGGTGHPAAR